VSQSGTAVTATSARYNGTIGTGGTASFGFNGSWTTSNPGILNGPYAGFLS
jgi:Cellulose binding domain